MLLNFRSREPMYRPGRSLRIRMTALPPRAYIYRYKQDARRDRTLGPPRKLPFRSTEGSNNLKPSHAFKVLPKMGIDMQNFTVVRSLFVTSFLITVAWNPLAAQQPTEAERDAIRSECRSDFL